MTRNKGILYLALCAALWSTAGVFIKLIDWNSLVIGGFRSAIAAAVLWIVLWRRGTPRPVWNRSTLLTGLCLGGTTALFVMANKLTTAANAIVLQSANPVFVLLFCAMGRGQRITRRDLTVVAVVMLGVVLFFVDDLSPGGLLGNTVALLSAVLLAAAFLFASSAASLHETMSGVLIGHLLSALIGVPFLFLEPPVFTPVSVGGDSLFRGVPAWYSLCAVFLCRAGLPAPCHFSDRDARTDLQPDLGGNLCRRNSGAACPDGRGHRHHYIMPLVRL